MNKYNKIFLALAITAVSAYATLDQTAWAQESTTTPDSVAEQGSFRAGPGRGEGRPGRGDHGGAAGTIDQAVTHAAVAAALNMTAEELDAAKEAGQTLAEIAEAQGVTLESVNAAAKASMTAQVNAALAAGEITQEQADAMIERIANRDLSEGEGRGRGERGEGSLGRGDQGGDRGGASGVIDQAITHAAVAAALNMTVEELDAAKEAGQTLAEVAEAQGVTLESVNAAAKASMAAQVNAALAAGEITQEQADAMIERIENGRPGRSQDDEATDEGTGTEPTTQQANALQRDATGSVVNVSLDNTILFLPTIVGSSN